MISLLVILALYGAPIIWHVTGHGDEGVMGNFRLATDKELYGG